ncbi:MAG TPA: metal-dependent hydrolase [Clostridiales bacterium]|nr:metal-dependent hydrolase [Clostridiales bacterium]
MTEKLYLEDSYIKEFDANVIDCIPYKDKYAVVLDKTAFYPEGGGQPSDTGYIYEQRVIYVFEENKKVLHIVNDKIPTKKVTCRIDWNRRYDFMQQHTGQHVLSHCFLKLFNGNTDSFHLTDNSVSIEIDIKDFTDEDLTILEDAANDIIYSNLPITLKIVNEKELKQLPLRKLPSVKDNIRIVSIGNIDHSPCGGTHVLRTGEVGIIKVIRWEKLKTSYRFQFLCGKRALYDYRNKNSVQQSLCAILSVRNHELEKTIDRIINENKDLNKKLQKKNKELLKYEAVEIYNNCIPLNGFRIIKGIYADRKFDDIKVLAAELSSYEKTAVLLGVTNGNAQIVFSRSDDINTDMNVLLKDLLSLIDGKGGGSPKTALGGGKAENLHLMIEEAYNYLLKSLS